MVPKKAVLPVGGWGTRFLPATKAVPKAMFPIMSKPLIHYAVDEAVDVGIEEIIFVLTPNSRAIEEYFSPHPDLERFLEQKGRSDSIGELRKTCSRACFSSTPAKPRGPYYGLGVGVWNAKRLVGQEPFAVLLPNDMLDAETPCMESLTAIYRALQCPVLAVHRVPVERLSAYGNVGIHPLDKDTLDTLPEGPYDRGRVWEVTRLIQKPDPRKNEHVSDLAIVGRFILSSEIFPVLESIPPGYEGEVQLIDAMEELRRKGQRVYAYEFEGQYFDTREESGYIRALLNEVAKRPSIWQAVHEMVVSHG